jgi:hypothetical protein
MKRTSVIIATAVATIFACVSNQPPSAHAPKAGKPLVSSLPAWVQGGELLGGTVNTREERLEMLATATTAGPAPAGDIVATVYKDSSGSNIYVEPLPPQYPPGF